MRWLFKSDFWFCAWNVCYIFINCYFNNFHIVTTLDVYVLLAVLKAAFSFSQVKLLWHLMSSVRKFIHFYGEISFFGRIVTLINQSNVTRSFNLSANLVSYFVSSNFSPINLISWIHFFQFTVITLLLTRHNKLRL